LDNNNPYGYWINLVDYQLVTRNDSNELVLIESDTLPFTADRNTAIPLNAVEF